MSFQIHALPNAPFAAAFALTDAELQARGARRVTADAVPGYPCRVSLRDAPVGAEVLLINHQHLSGNTPYAASHAIYVSRDAEAAAPKVGEVPKILSCRLLSLRGFDAEGMMRDADVVDGADAAEGLRALFSDPQVTEVHVHFAKRGCFAARVTRAQG